MSSLTEINYLVIVSNRPSPSIEGLLFFEVNTSLYLKLTFEI
jgi:hypothetical protein